MPIKHAIVGSSVGLHARPATLVARVAAAYDEDILLRLVGMDPADAVDAGSSMMIMTLGAEAGAEVVIESENQAAVDEIAAMIERDLDAAQ